MSSRIVAVDADLEEIREHLCGQGYEVVASNERCRPVEAVVYSGPPLLEGMRSCCAKGTALINAAGLSAESVEMHLDERLGE